MGSYRRAATTEDVSSVFWAHNWWFPEKETVQSQAYCHSRAGGESENFKNCRSWQRMLQGFWVNLKSHCNHKRTEYSSDHLLIKIQRYFKDLHEGKWSNFIYSQSVPAFMIVLNKKGLRFPNDNTTMVTWLYVQPYNNVCSMTANSCVPTV